MSAPRKGPETGKNVEGPSADMVSGLKQGIGPAYFFCRERSEKIL